MILVLNLTLSSRIDWSVEMHRLSNRVNPPLIQSLLPSVSLINQPCRPSRKANKLDSSICRFYIQLVKLILRDYQLTNATRPPLSIFNLLSHSRNQGIIFLFTRSPPPRPSWGNAQRRNSSVSTRSQFCPRRSRQQFASGSRKPPHTPGHHLSSGC